MPYLLIVAGVVLLVSGVRDTTKQLFSLLSNDFATHNSYLSWMFAILVVGSAGYIRELRPLSRAFMGLIVVVLILSNGGFFQKFQQEFASLGGSKPSLSFGPENPDTVLQQQGQQP